MDLSDIISRFRTKTSSGDVQVSADGRARRLRRPLPRPHRPGTATIPFAVVVEHNEARTVVRCTGEIASDRAHELRLALADAIRPKPDALVIDLRKVSAFCSAGVEVLEGTALVCGTLGTSLEIWVSDPVRRVLELVHRPAIRLRVTARRPPTSPPHRLARSLLSRES
jgi:anti-anti-sigma factor